MNTIENNWRMYDKCDATHEPATYTFEWKTKSKSGMENENSIKIFMCRKWFIKGNYTNSSISSTMRKPSRFYWAIFYRKTIFLGIRIVKQIGWKNIDADKWIDKNILSFLKKVSKQLSWNVQRKKTIEIYTLIKAKNKETKLCSRDF